MSKTKLLPLIIFLLGVVFLLSCAGEKSRVCFKGNCFYVELAITPDTWSKGLMFRKGLPKNQGMLFIFDKEEDVSFWMKNTLIPLDIIWINQEKKVVFIKENAQPCFSDTCPSISPGKRAKYVLELNSGISNDISLEVGDSFKFYIKEPPSANLR